MDLEMYGQSLDTHAMHTTRRLSWCVQPSPTMQTQTFDVVVLVLPSDAQSPRQGIVDHDEHECGPDKADDSSQEAYADVGRPVCSGGYLGHREYVQLSEVGVW